MRPLKLEAICTDVPTASMTSSRRGMERSLSFINTEQRRAPVLKGQNATMKYLTLSGNEIVKKSLHFPMRWRLVSMAYLSKRAACAESSFSI